MNVNGARFHLLLGAADWARCRADAAPDESPGGAAALPLPAWDAQRHDLSLPPAVTELPATPGELPLTLEARRAAAADRHGNLYRVGDDGSSLWVQAAHGSGPGVAAGALGETRWWPPEPVLSTCSDGHGQRADFVPLAVAGVEPVALDSATVAAAMVAANAAADTLPHAAEHYGALAVTDDDYLVVAFQRVWPAAAGTAGGAAAQARQHGLLSFDLLAGGPPHETLWPAGLAAPPRAWALCARAGGGLWLLDREQRRLWELDGKLAAITAGQPLQDIAAAVPDAAAHGFQPLAGPRRETAVNAFPAGLDLSTGSVAVTDPIGLTPELARSAAGGQRRCTGAVLLLDRDSAGQRSRVLRLQRRGHTWLQQASAWLPGLLAQDFVHAAAPQWLQVAAQGAPLFITDSRGNQALAFAWQAGEGGVTLQRLPELYPLRRHGGRALLAVRGLAYYDSGLGAAGGGVMWTAVVQQPRQRWQPLAELVTPVFDSQDVGTVWDKLLLDAQIPADTAVQVDSRAGDDLEPAPDASPADMDVLGAWQAEPAPRLRTEGPELPWLRSAAARATQRDTGTGTWELLLQRAQGRYLQLRLRLASPGGGGTPRLRALRVWQPRFSYPQRFLPAVYREDPVQGPFLERWLANFESTLTGLEDRIATVQSLLDPRTVPADTLAWLAGWFEVALDPAWDERRQRLFVRHAMDFFRWRGTVHGLRLALELAFDPCFDEAAFAGPRPQDEGPRRIRIVEAYQTRLLGALAAGDPQAFAAGDTGPVIAGDSGGFATGDPAGIAPTLSSAAGPQSVQTQARWTPAEGNAGLADRLARWRDPQAAGATPAAQITPFPLQAPADMPTADWQAFCTATLGFVPGLGLQDRNRWQGFLAARHASLAVLNAVHGTAWPAWTSITLPPDLPASAGAATDWHDFGQTPWLQRQRWQAFLAGRYRRAERLRTAHGTRWPAFDQVPLPDALPATVAAQTDWLQFEGALQAMYTTAHRFSVLLPVTGLGPQDLATRQALAQRIVALEKPAHTVFDVRFFWAFNRVGEARLGLDTQLGAGSRAPELIPDAVVGQAYVGTAFVGGTPRPAASDRLRVDC